MLCPELENEVLPAVTAELLGVSVPLTTLEPDAAGTYCEVLWNRWCPPPQCCEFAFP